MTSTTQHGFFHSIKEKLFQGESHADADYDSARAKYGQLSESLYKLKSGAHNYASSLYSVFLNSNNTAVEFSSLLGDSQLPNEYQNMTKQLTAAHSQLTGEKQQALTTRLQDNVLAPIDQQLLAFQSLQTRIAKRDELHSNLDYYLNKVAGLNKERDERSSKGKSETSSNREKLDRNMQKLDVARREYTAYASQLIADLLNVWNQRVAILGPALAGFVECEKMFVEMYGSALSGVNNSGPLSSQLPAGIVPASVMAGDVGVPVPAQALGPIGISATSGLPSTDPHGFHQSPIQQTHDVQQSGSTVSPVQQTNDVQQVQQHLSSIDLQQQQQQQQPIMQQQPIGQSPPQQGLYGGISPQPIAPQQPVAESFGHSAGAPVDQNPFEKVEGQQDLQQPQQLGGGVIFTPPEQQQQHSFGAEGGQLHSGIGQSAPLKSDHEDESKRQRFEEEQKARLIDLA